MKINEKIYNLRKEHNLSQEELADKLNVSRQTISKWELGESNPDFDKIEPLCEVFNITTEELLRDKKENKIPGEKPDTVKVILICVSILLYFMGCMSILLSKKVWNLRYEIGIAIFLAFAAIATVILVYTLLTRRSNSKPKANYSDYDSDPVISLIIGIISIIFTIIYLLVSFYTHSWHLTWIIWLVYAIAVRVVKLVFELKKRNKKESDQ